MGHRSKRPVRGAKIDKRIRTHFKEWARQIIARDREARKYGRSQNTIGEIERALVEAFLLGREIDDAALAVAQANDGFIDWIEIPPRARGTLFSISIKLSGSAKRQSSSQAIYLERILIDGRYRWCADGDDKHDRTFSDGGVIPLVKLGLLERLDKPETRFGLTERGYATCREFWRRWKENDPTLPIMNARV